ncbi:energy-coupling factor ABC transporter ATP-binding protein [Gracilibacillus dipsosauri]|uniref:Energy-coupling factor transporter ATP-binding protein EcfA2 n=1 Tax=Gracilibacillus dipsosauri TaxID=178340 RepID=A0A317KVY2_9BACI|nr:energy-coupling factor ABC transporter ATP-binding protein [Gracilibacillus dipsosauri]PWU67443.1 energy-coupling factor ABC transporter ATP-binding protein [Gracilibacillus dipsosauri]
MDILFKNVNYTYQANTPFAFKALKNISFTIPSGKYMAIIGHTGSGKSTLLQHINGLLLPTEGTVKVGDYLLEKGRKSDLKGLRQKVGIVFQYPEHQLFEETVEKDISFGPKNFGVAETEIKARVRKAITDVGLTEEILAKSPFELSGGQMRRVAIAGVLAVEPEILVLDEPTAGLDPKGQKEIMELFYHLHKQKNRTTILVTHHMDDAFTYADQILILKEGAKLMEGTPDQIFQKRDLLTSVQLGLPEILAFVETANKKFPFPIEYNGQSLDLLVEEIEKKLKRAKQ